MNPFIPLTPSGERAAIHQPYIGTEQQATPVNRTLDTKEAVKNVLTDALREIQERYPNRFDFEVMTTYPKSVQNLDSNLRNKPLIPKVVITLSRVSTPELMRFMGNIMVGAYNATNLNQSVTTRGKLDNDVIEIAVWTLHPILRDKMMVLIRQLLFEKQDVLYSRYGLIKWIRTGGRDDEVDVGKLPRTIYRAVSVYAATIKLEQIIVDQIIEEIVTTSEIYQTNAEGIEVSTPEVVDTSTPPVTGYLPPITPVYYSNPLDTDLVIDETSTPATPPFPQGDIT